MIDKPDIYRSKRSIMKTKLIMAIVTAAMLTLQSCATLGEIIMATKGGAE